MAERIVSPGVFTNEKDQSFLQRGISEIGAAFIGTTIKGPALIPTKVNSYSEFEQMFGSYTEDSYLPFAVQEYLKNSGVCTITRLLYEDGYKLDRGLLAVIAKSGSVEHVTHILHPSAPVTTTGASSPIFEKSKLVSNDSGSFVIDVSGSFNSSQDAAPGFSSYTQEVGISGSIDSNANNYITKIFGTNPKGVKYPVYVQYENASAASLFENLGDVEVSLGIIDYENTADGKNGFASTPMVTSQKVGQNTADLFQAHTLSHGNVENFDVKIGIRDVKLPSEVSDPNGYGTFTVEVRRINSTDLPNSPFDSDDTDKSPDILEAFTNCNLDKDSPNYIARKIGDQFTTIDENGKIKDNGEYPNISKYIRITVSNGVKNKTEDKSLVPFGFKAMNSPIPDAEDASGNLPAGRTLDVANATDGTGGTAGIFNAVTTTSNGDGSGTKLTVVTSNANGKLIDGGSLTVNNNINNGDDTNSPYLNVDLSDGTGNGAQATVEVTGNTVTSVTVTAIGSGYAEGDILKIAAGELGGTSGEVTLNVLAAGNLLVEPTSITTVDLGSGYAAGDRLTVDSNLIGNSTANLEVTLQPGDVSNLTQGLLKIQYATSQVVNGSYSPKNYYGFDFTNLNNLNYLAPIPTTGLTIANNEDFYLGDMLQATSSNFPSLLSPYTGSIQEALDEDKLSKKVALSSRKFMVAMQGGFDGARPNLMKLSGENISATNTFGFDCSSNTSTGTKAYQAAFDALSNTDFFDINMLVTPGILHSKHSAVTAAARQLVEDRQDTFYVMDTPAINDTINATINNVTSLDSNYTSTYFPWVRIIDPSKNKPIFVPPSVLVPGALSFNDAVSAPWYAPAGLTRGGLTTAINTYEKLTQADRDDLYEARINPIANFPNQGICIWGQKTLQARPSALDRVNVRRLLITVKKFIASATKFLVFEQNTDATRLRFLGIVNPYLEGVRSQQGLSAFRVVMDDTNNTPDLIDQNILYGQIFLQPTRTAEFIVLDFNIQPTGASFPE